MNSTIYKTLKDNFKNSSNTENSSIISLCITELSSENYVKAIELSEELIKKDINDSAGWAMKALAQSNMFDYENNLFYLKSSLTSLEEFKEKTSLSPKDIQSVDAVFTIAFLQRTIFLVNQRLQEVIELRRKAVAEKTKAKTAMVGAVLSGYMGSKSTSDVGKIIGYGGMMAGAMANAQFQSNANLLNEASKGIFGVAIANISATIEKAIKLKSIINELDRDVCEQATTVLHDWINMLAFLYQQVVENLLVYSSDLKKKNALRKRFRSGVLDLINAPEMIQFVYLTKLLGIDNSIAEFNDIENTLFSIKQIKEPEIKATVRKMHFIALGLILSIYITPIFQVILGESTIYLSMLLCYTGIGLYIKFMYWPIGKVGALKKLIKDLVFSLENFKINSDKIIIENIKF